MSSFQVLLVAGTHGNEINAPWLFDQWREKPDLIDESGLRVCKVIGNPKARQKVQRYIDRDLNRSFLSRLLELPNPQDLEVCRARELLQNYGSKGFNPSQLVIDFHSTTAAMGSSIVVYGRRPADLAIVSLIQKKTGLPIYLHEGDQAQKGFLVESWPCGFVVEIGPVPQGLLHSRIIHQTKLILEQCLFEIASAIHRQAVFPKNVVIHRHLKNIDFPRDSLGLPHSFIHPDIQGKDWIPIQPNDPLFINLKGDVINLSKYSINYEVVPVFINEAAYAEKHIAMSLTQKEVWNFEHIWEQSFYDLYDNCY